MTPLGLQVCLTWAIMSVLVSVVDFFRINWGLLNLWRVDGDYSLSPSVSGISGIVGGSVASSVLRLLASARHS